MWEGYATECTQQDPDGPEPGGPSTTRTEWIPRDQHGTRSIPDWSRADRSSSSNGGDDGSVYGSSSKRQQLAGAEPCVAPHAASPGEVMRRPGRTDPSQTERNTLRTCTESDLWARPVWTDLASKLLHVNPHPPQRTGALLKTRLELRPCFEQPSQADTSTQGLPSTRASRQQEPRMLLAWTKAGPD